MTTVLPQKCPLCQQDILTANYQHVLQECLLASSVTRISKAYFLYQDQKYCCFRCLQFFSKEQWETHRKKIRVLCPFFQKEESLHQQQKMGESSKKFSYSTPSKPTGEAIKSMDKSVQIKKWSSNVSRSMPESSYYFSSLRENLKFNQTMEVTDKEKLVLLLIEIFISKSKIFLLEWVKTNNRIRQSHLQIFFNRYIDKTLLMLKKQIRNPDFQFLTAHYNIKWNQILDEATDIFDRQKILEKTEKLKPTAKLRILRCINSIYKKEYQDIFQQFSLNFYQPLTEKNKLPVKTIEFLDILRELFETKQKSLIHIAIDLFLIFQSAQRFPSDKIPMQKGVLQLLEKRKTGEECSAFQMKISKTKKSVSVVLGQQLCQLLQQFGWKMFYRSGNLYRRMFKIFGFGLYSLKRGILTQYALQQYKHINLDIKTLTGHSKIKTTHIYTKTATQWIKKEIKDVIKIPDLRIENESRQSITDKLGHTSLSSKNYISINSQWLSKLKASLKYYNKEYLDFCAQKISQPLAGLKDQTMNLQLIGTEVNEEILAQKEKGNFNILSQAETVFVLQQKFSFKNSKFNLKELFHKIGQNYCKNCQQKILEGYSCFFCLSAFHDQCLPLFCPCTSSPFHPFRGISIQATTSSKLQLRLPQEYFGNQELNQSLNSIKFLIAARRFYYTSTQIEPFPLKMPQLHGPSKFEIKNFQRYEEYQRGQYFPPLQLGVSGNQTVSGTGFGLFASEPIEKNCFIGQYAADILDSFNTIQIKRPDSIFSLIEKQEGNQIVIGPVLHCGYCCLINSRKEEEANCKSIRLIINGVLRVIIYSCKKIKKGQEISYDYAAGKREKQVFNQKNIQIVQDNNKLKEISAQQLQWLQDFLTDDNKEDNASENISCGLQNASQSCYLNSVFQALKWLPQMFLFQQNISVLLVLSNLYKKMSGQSVFNPQKFYKHFLLKSKGCFQPSVQNDAHQFLIFLFQLLNQPAKDLFRIKVESLDVCSNCQASAKNSFECLTYNIPASQQRLNSLFQGKEESIVEDFFCSSCKVRAAIRRNQCVVRYPHFLIVHIERYRTTSKDRTPINYTQTAQSQYKLVGFICHIGPSVHSGHYFSVQRKGEEQYIIYNDRIVKKTTHLFYEDAYILIYKKEKSKEE